MAKIILIPQNIKRGFSGATLNPEQTVLKAHVQKHKVYGDDILSAHIIVVELEWQRI